MEKFVYTGKSDGKPIRGIMSAETEQDLVARLNRLGISDVQILSGQQAPAVAVAEEPASAPPPQNMMQQVDDLAKQAIRSMEPVKPPPRRQTVFVGEQNKIVEQVNRILSSGRALVCSLSMHPDPHGNMILAIVVEHDVEDRRK